MTKNDDEEGCWRSYRHIIVLFLFLLLWLLTVVLFRDRLHMVAFLMMMWSLGSRIDDEDQGESYRPSYSGWDQRCEKISNNSSFGIIDIAEQSSTSDRIIVIVITACLIDDGAYR